MLDGRLHWISGAELREPIRGARRPGRRGPGVGAVRFPGLLAVLTKPGQEAFARVV